MATLGGNLNDINFSQTLAPGSSLSNTLRTNLRACMNSKLYYSTVHRQIHLATQFANGILWHFKNVRRKTGFLVLKGQHMRCP